MNDVTTMKWIPEGTNLLRSTAKHFAHEVTAIWRWNHINFDWHNTLSAYFDNPTEGIESTA